jgi:hypothetical protein
MMYTSCTDLMYSHGLRMLSVHTCLENTSCSHGRILEAVTKYGNLVSPSKWIINSFCFQPYTPIHGPGRLSRYSDSLRAERLGDRIPVGVRISGPVQTGPGAHPAPYTLGTESMPGIKPGRALTTHPHVALRLKKEKRYTPIPLLCLHGSLLSELYLYAPL